MLTKQQGYLRPRTETVPDSCQDLQDLGYVVLREVLSADATAALKAELEAVYLRYGADGRAASRSPEEDEDFRYEMFNRSAAAQRVVAHPDILAVIEPLLGEDCHIIANTCWRNPPDSPRSHGGGFWHIDAGPHIPRDPNIPWDDRIPYPVFAIGCHIYVQDCPLESGPTGVLPGSHKSGQPPPRERVKDDDLTFEGTRVEPLVAEAGDVALFVSDVWHRRLPTLTGDSGRFFLQVHYGRRDIAQRIRTTAEVNHLTEEAIARLGTERERQLFGLHAPFFYDG